MAESGTTIDSSTTTIGEDPPKRRLPPGLPLADTTPGSSTTTIGEDPPKRKSPPKYTLPDTTTASSTTTIGEEPPKRKTPTKPPSTPPPPPQPQSPKTSRVEGTWHWKHWTTQLPEGTIEKPVYHRRETRDRYGSYEHDDELEAEEEPPLSKPPSPPSKPPSPPSKPPTPPSEPPSPPEPRKLSVGKKPLPPVVPEEKRRKSSAEEKPLPPEPEIPKERRGPPPLIGQHGKEIPRPLDRLGRPMPVYVTEDGKPILDSKDKPIPLQYDEHGRPEPLELDMPSSFQVAEKEQAWTSKVSPSTRKKWAFWEESIVPLWLSLAGGVNTLISFSIACLIGYAYYLLDIGKLSVNMEKSMAEKALISSLVFTLIEGCIGLANKAETTKNVISIWLVLSTVLFIAQGCILYFLDAVSSEMNLVCVWYSGFIFVYVLIGTIGHYGLKEDDEEPPRTMALVMVPEAAMEYPEITKTQTTLYDYDWYDPNW